MEILVALAFIGIKTKKTFWYVYILTERATLIFFLFKISTSCNKNATIYKTT